MKKLLLLTLILFSAGLSAQTMRTAYFMENAVTRSTLNPALTPMRGYVNIPAIGATNMAFTSNALALDDVLYKNPNGKGLVTFLDGSVDKKRFLSQLKKKNTIDTDFGMNIIGFGFYSGKAFWSFDINIKANANIGIPKNFFEFVAYSGESEDGAHYVIKDLNVSINTYAEAALGYARPINDKLSVGGRVKFLAGMGDMNMTYDRMDIMLTEQKWAINASGRLDASANGLTLKNKINDKGEQEVDLDELDFSPNGLAGTGFGIDLGASYKLLDNLNLSAALVDLGFISWSKKHTQSALATANYEFMGSDFTEGTSSEVDGFDDVAKFHMTDSKKRTTSLRTTMNLGAEYTILDNLLGFGLLSSTQFRRSGAFSELTVSANVRPCSWFSAAVSYSMLHSGFKTAGVAVNFHPSWINLFIGTDYILGKVSEQFIPINQRAANLYFGLAIPLAKRAK